MDSKAILDFLKSNGGRGVLEGVFGMLASKGQSDQAERQSGINQQMSRDQLAMMDKQTGVNDRLSRDQSLATQAPVGWEQQYLQQQLMKNIALQKLLQPKQLWHPNEKIMERLSTMPKAPQLAVPDDWKSVNPFGTGLSMEALAGRQGTLDLLSGGRGPGIDFAQMGLSPEEAQRLNQRTGGYRGQVGSEYERTTGQSPLQTAIQPQGGGGSRAGGALGGAATGATLGSIIPGVGTLAGGIVGGIGGLLFGGGKKPQPQQQMAPAAPAIPRMANPYTQGQWAPQAQPAMAGPRPMPQDDPSTMDAIRAKLIAAMQRPRRSGFGLQQ